VTRLIYRFLVALHPRDFRDRHGAEMLCVFDECVRGDECAPGEARTLLADGLVSLARQWTLHSGAWKLLAGGVISTFLILGWAYSVTRGLDYSINWAAERHAKLLAMYPAPPVPALNQVEFQREAAQAVKILAHDRAEKRHRHSGFVAAPPRQLE
jgi:hypothetical protein